MLSPMSDLLDYRLDGAVAVLTLDDGKANAYSHDALDAIGEGLDPRRAGGHAPCSSSGGRASSPPASTSR